jgi:hypothetical protein
MTLILGMSKADGSWQSSDYRVTNARTGELIDDASMEFFCESTTTSLLGGPIALMAYTASELRMAHWSVTSRSYGAIA